MIAASLSVSADQDSMIEDFPIPALPPKNAIDVLRQFDLDLHFLPAVAGCWIVFCHSAEEERGRGGSVLFLNETPLASGWAGQCCGWDSPGIFSVRRMKLP